MEPPLPTWNWWGKVNSFRCPAGREPGQGWLLMHRGDLDALDTNAAQDLVLQYAQTVTLKSLVVVGATCVSPFALGNGQPAYLVEVADWRYLLANFGTPADKAYNVRSSPGAATFKAATLNGASPWTWVAMVRDLWETMPASGLGAWPGLPFTPDGTPEAFEFYQTNAYHALCDVLDRLACVLTLNPFTTTFGVARLGSTDTILQDALLRWDGVRVWDDDPVQPAVTRLPQTVRVCFRRQPEATDGSSPWYAVDQADTAPAVGACPGGYVLVHDDLAALGASGTPTNSAALATRATERAADWFRATRNGYGRLRKVYRDVLPENGFVPAAQLGGLAYEDRGLGYKTELGRGGAVRDLARVYCCAVASGGAGPGTLTVEEVDGVPSYGGVSILQLDSDDGFRLSQPVPATPEKVRVDIAAADLTVRGIVSLTDQYLGGVSSVKAINRLYVGGFPSSFAFANPAWTTPEAVRLFGQINQHVATSGSTHCIYYSTSGGSGTYRTDLWLTKSGTQNVPGAQYAWSYAVAGTPTSDNGLFFYWQDITGPPSYYFALKYGTFEIASGGRYAVGTSAGLTATIANVATINVVGGLIISGTTLTSYDGGTF